jgi:hypothetical protein
MHIQAPSLGDVVRHQFNAPFLGKLFREVKIVWERADLSLVQVG